MSIATGSVTTSPAIISAKSTISATSAPSNDDRGDLERRRDCSDSGDDCDQYTVITASESGAGKSMRSMNSGRRPNRYRESDVTLIRAEKVDSDVAYAGDDHVGTSTVALVVQVGRDVNNATTNSVAINISDKDSSSSSSDSSITIGGNTNNITSGINKNPDLISSIDMETYRAATKKQFFEKNIINLEHMPKLLGEDKISASLAKETEMHADSKSSGMDAIFADGSKGENKDKKDEKSSRSESKR